MIVSHNLLCCIQWLSQCALVHKAPDPISFSITRASMTDTWKLSSLVLCFTESSSAVYMYKLTKLAYNRLRARPSRREELQQSVPPCSHQLRARNETIGSAGVFRDLGQSDLNAPSQIQLKSSSQNDSQKPQDSCQICKKKNHDSRVYRWKLVCGLFLPYVLASLDLTIVASALPFIASHFGMFLLHPTNLSNMNRR